MKASNELSMAPNLGAMPNSLPSHVIFFFLSFFCFFCNSCYLISHFNVNYCLCTMSLTVIVSVDAFGARLFKLLH